MKSPKPNDILGVSGCRDLFKKLEAEGEALAPHWRPYDCFNFVITAWHLYEDWIKADRLAAPRLALNKIEKAKTPPEMQLVLDALRDVANASKHVAPKKRSQGPKVLTATHGELEPDLYSWFFHEDMPGLSVENSYFSIRVLRNILLRYFSWVFNDAIPVDDFPPEILEAIAYCNIGSRTGNGPPLWLVDVEHSR